MNDPEPDAIRQNELRKLQDALRQHAAPTAVAAVLEATDASIEHVIAQQPRLVVDAYATWCGPCKTFAPTFTAAAQRHPNLAFVKVDVDRNPDFAQKYGIQSIPTLLLFAAGRLVGQIPGALRAPGLEQVLQQLEVLPA